MAESINVQGNTRKDKYESLLPQIKALTEGETDAIANLSNIFSALKYGMGFFWAGIYFVKNDELVLGPFQGPVACTRIKKGKGVCGTAWEKKQVIIVPDVDRFPGHIACSSLSKSEIVLPCFKKGEIIAVVDVDSDKPDDFDETDRRYLAEVVTMIENII
ncbi:MAG: GAF domain-containing protein [Bacteroidota bacterium]